jgi:hypothetical protein
MNSSESPQWGYIPTKGANPANAIKNVSIAGAKQSRTTGLYRGWRYEVFKGGGGETAFTEAAEGKLGGNAVLWRGIIKDQRTEKPNTMNQATILFSNFNLRFTNISAKNSIKVKA